jgi:hypothetical protein
MTLCVLLPLSKMVPLYGPGLRPAELTITVTEDAGGLQGELGGGQTKPAEPGLTFAHGTLEPILTVKVPDPEMGLIVIVLVWELSPSGNEKLSELGLTENVPSARLAPARPAKARKLMTAKRGRFSSDTYTSDDTLGLRQRTGR